MKAPADPALRTLPHNKDAEFSVLSACFKSNEVFAKSLEVLNQEDFYYQNHKLIFQAMLALFEANEEIDILTVAEKLKIQGNLQTVGDVDFLSLVEDHVPTGQAITHHAKIVREKKILRDLIVTAEEIRENSYQEFENVDLILDRAEQSIFQISEKKVKRSFFPIKEIVKDSFVQIEKLFEKPGLITGVETGFKELDQLTSGLQPSDLVILAARPSMGKTSFALDIVRFAALHGKTPSAIFSLEMSKEQLGIRLLCAESRTNLANLRKGFLGKSDWPNLTTAAGKLSESAIFIDDTPSMTVLDVRARARRLKAEHDIGLIVIDYLQLMHVMGNVESRQQEISQISRGLKALAKELNIPIVALSQLSRAVESRTDKRPMLADLRESGAIEQDADVVAFIYRDEVYDDNSPDAGKAEILVRKQRNGPIGEVRLAFLKEYTRFENLADFDEPFEDVPV